MLNLLTASASVLAALLIVQFVLGLISLWQSAAPATKPQPQPEPPVFDNVPIKAPEALESVDDTNPWFEPLEAATPSKPAAITAANQVVKFQLLLPAAKEPQKVDLMALSIRELKSRAKAQGIKSYSRWTKAQLALALG